MVRTLARVAVALTSLAVLVAAAAGAIMLHQNSSGSRSGGQAGIVQDGYRLREIRTLLLGSGLPPSRGTCISYVYIDQARTGHRYPARGSAGWQRVLADCSGSGH